MPHWIALSSFWTILNRAGMSSLKRFDYISELMNQYQVSGETKVRTLAPGSYFGSKGESIYQISSKAEEESIIYIRTEGKFDIISLL